MSNATPDLDDEEYLKQLYALSALVSVMPGAQKGMPDVTTPPPIRARWAAYLISYGVRVDSELATHQIQRIGPRGAGGFSPSMRSQINGRQDLEQMMQEMIPDLYERYKKGEVTKEDLRQHVSEDVMQAVRDAEKAT